MRVKNVFSLFCCLGSTSIFLITSGVILLASWSSIFQAILHANKQLRPDTFIFRIWQKAPVVVNLDVYFFNWTNPHDILNKSIKPHFKELGPYRFSEIKEKKNIVFNDNGTVSYQSVRKWYFNPEESQGNLYDPIVTLNPVATSAAYASRYWGYFLRKGLSVALNALTGIHVTKTASQFLFEGYNDPLLHTARSLPFLSHMFPKEFDKFGWFYSRNNSGTYEGDFNMNTGVNGTLGRLRRWRHENYSKSYPEECSDISSSAGEFFPDNLTPKDKIKFFTSDLCRPVVLDFEKETSVSDILAYKYAGADSFLDNGTKIQDNACFCVGECQPSGMLNVSACRLGSPAFVSLPHFYNADPYYLNSVEGLSPNKEQHEFAFTFEPTFGIPLDIRARLQVNLLLQPDDTVSLFKEVPKIYFPMFWFEQVATTPDYLLFWFKVALNAKTISILTGIVLILLGLSLNTCYFYRIFTRKFVPKPKPFPREMVPLKSDLNSD